MATFSRQDIVDGLKRLGQLAEPSLYQLLAMKLSAWRDDVDVSDARRLLKEIIDLGQTRDEIWPQLEPFLVPGDELTAQYAFQDLWDALDGNN